MDKVVLVFPAVILIVIGAIILTGYTAPPSTPFVDQRTNFQNLVILNAGTDDSGLPSFSPGTTTIQAHVDVSAYVPTSFTGSLRWTVMSADWTQNLTNGFIYWSGTANTYNFRTPTDPGVYILAIWFGSQIIFWQHFSIVDQSVQSELGFGTIALGVIVLIIGVLPSSRYSWK
jgi:hypothetical protein